MSPGGATTPTIVKYEAEQVMPVFFNKRSISPTLQPEHKSTHCGKRNYVHREATRPNAVHRPLAHAESCVPSAFALMEQVSAQVVDMKNIRMIAQLIVEHKVRLAALPVWGVLYEAHSCDPPPSHFALFYLPQFLPTLPRFLPLSPLAWCLDPLRV